MEYDYLFSENGLVAYKEGKLIGNQVIAASLRLLSIFIAASGCLIVLDVGTHVVFVIMGYVGGAEFESPSW